VDAVDPSPAMKQLMHVSDHSALLSAEVTDQCSCNCASPVCLHGVHRDSFVFYYCFRGMTSISTWTSSCPGENASGVVSWNVVIQQYCVVSKQRMLLSDDLYETGMLGKLCEFWFSFCAMLIY